MTQNHLVNVVEEEEDLQKMQLQSNVFLPDELIAEIISSLSVKNIVRLKCVSKSWNILISHPTFVQKHHKKSSQNPRLILTQQTWLDPSSTIESYPLHCLLKNPSSIEPCLLENPLKIVPGYYYHWLGNKFKIEIIGTYKGLLCLHFRYNPAMDWTWMHSFCLWNPATRTISGEFGTFYGDILSRTIQCYSFGCDISTGTSKVVEFRPKRDRENHDSWRSQVRIFNLRDNSWRNIESFSPIPFYCNLINGNNNGVHLSGTVNWLTLSNYGRTVYCYKDISYVKQFVIISLDPSTETYTRFLLPSGFDEVPHFPPTLHLLVDCLCFSHDFKQTEFVIWQMKEFGVQESWTQLFRIDYTTFANYNLNPYTLLLPLYLSKNGDTLILGKCGYAKCEYYHEAIIYNQRDNRVETITTSNNWSWFSSMDYIESLFSTPSMSATPTQSISSIHDGK